jgi:hypothetical protein
VGVIIARAVTLYPEARIPRVLSANRKLPLGCKRNLPKDRSHPISALFHQTNLTLPLLIRSQGETTIAQRHQRGWLKKEKRAQGETWILFFRTTR